MLGALRSAWAACKICLKTNCNRVEGVGSVVEPLSRSPPGRNRGQGWGYSPCLDPSKGAEKSLSDRMFA